MPLKITKAADPIQIDRLVLCIYGAPGLGKTTLAFTADRALLLDFDKGAHRAAARQDSVQVSAWGDVAALTAEELAPYETVIVDTAGRALDCLSLKIMGDNPKMKGYGGALSLQGYGALKTAFTGWLNQLRGMGKDVILIAHSDEQRNGDEVIERLDVQGGSKGEIYKCADAMGRIKIIDGKRVLIFSPTDTAFGKNPAQLPPLPIPSPEKDRAFLAGVIAQTKAKLNEQSEAAVAELKRFTELRDTFMAYTEAENFTAAVGSVTTPKDKALLNECAIAAGFVYDKSGKQYVRAVKAAA
ncbi:MAG: ATP-binding protein [Stagnimonas sp.]|nr:ATP-binding protein [Stagnimonas sp.]